MMIMEKEKHISFLNSREVTRVTVITSRPIVYKVRRVKAGEVIADGASTSNGEIALGKNPLIGFMTWEGYNYEDAVLLSERLSSGRCLYINSY
ncbi:MAG: hypothetical protein ACLUR5_17745 [Eubacterium ventriosum]